MSRLFLLFLMGCASAPPASSVEHESNSIEAVSGGGVSAEGQDVESEDRQESQDTASQQDGFSIDGQWTYSGGAELENSCPDLGETSSSEVTEAGFSISTVSDTLFDLLLGGSTEAMSCTLTGLSFACNPTTIYETFDYDGFDVTIGITTTYTGSFLSEQHISSEYQLDVFCDEIEWVGCDVAVDLPCVVRFTADAYR